MFRRWHPRFFGKTYAKTALSCFVPRRNFQRAGSATLRASASYISRYTLCSPQTALPTGEGLGKKQCFAAKLIRVTPSLIGPLEPLLEQAVSHRCSCCWNLERLRQLWPWPFGPEEPSTIRSEIRAGNFTDTLPDGYASRFAYKVQIATLTRL